jgi:phosphatidate cytidylyltransferase
MLSCVGQKKNFWLSVPMLLIALAFPNIMRYYYLSSADNSNALFTTIRLALSVFLILALYVFGVAVFANKKLSVTDAGLIYSSISYIVAAFTAIVYIHDYISYGKYIYLLVFICAWMTDIFAYFIGRFFGKHKLIPAVSPKKTVEGAIGGIVFCVISTVVFGIIMDTFFVESGSANYIVLAISGIFISVVSQIGDLIMSVIKRHYGIKDYGKLFPGHGGILDRFDSVLAVSVLLAVITTYFNMFA